MRRSLSALGGGERFKFPEYVWSPSGGWWNNTRPDWQRNTVLAFAGIGVASSFVFYVSVTNERRYRAPDRPILSQRWASHTEEDDPQYHEKLQRAASSKIGFWDRVWPDSGDHH